MKNAFVCSWEDAFRKGGSFLSEMVDSAFDANGIGKPFAEPQADYADLRLQVEARLGDLQALPTLPGVVRKILSMLKNPATTIDELEVVLSTDPVIVQKIRQIVASPLFAGQASSTAKFTLKDAIVRIGLKEIGAIAMQVMVVNSFVEVSGTLFDFKRFWGHSVGCALAADKIYKSQIVKFPDELSFQDYWLGGLLHDIGKLVLGVFFWDHF
jgi:HD-like signal output (HDOD) protein